MCSHWPLRPRWPGPSPHHRRWTRTRCPVRPPHRCRSSWPQWWSARGHEMEEETERQRRGKAMMQSFHSNIQHLWWIFLCLLLQAPVQHLHKEKLSDWTLRVTLSLCLTGFQSSSSLKLCPEIKLLLLIIRFNIGPAATKLYVNTHVSMMLNFKLDEKTNVMRQRVGLSSYREQRRAHVRFHVLIVQRHDLHQVL